MQVTILRLFQISSLAILFSFYHLTAATAGDFKVRAGAKKAEVKAPPANSSSYKFKMVSVIKGKAGNRFLVHRVMDRKWTDFLYWKERFTLVEAKANRQNLANYLEKHHYAGVRINNDGVEFLIEYQTDLGSRLLKADETYKTQKKYQPNDCDRVIGICKFTVLERGKEPLYLMRKSSFKNGIWRDVESYDPARDPQKRSKVRDERIFSVDATGVNFDMQTTRHTGRQVEVFQMTRISPPLAGHAKKKAKTAAKPKLPSGAGNTFGQTCDKDSLDISSGDKRWTLKRGDKKALNTNSRELKIYCIQGRGHVGTSCPANSHVRAIYDTGWLVLGCYKGAIPEKPFG